MQRLFTHYFVKPKRHGVRERDSRHRDRGTETLRMSVQNSGNISSIAFLTGMARETGREPNKSLRITPTPYNRCLKYHLSIKKEISIKI